MGVWTSAASEKPKVVHWPFINLMQRILEHIVFTNAASWKRKFIKVIYQMSNTQVKAIVQSLVTVVRKPQLNSAMELQNHCRKRAVVLQFPFISTGRESWLENRRKSIKASEIHICRTSVK